MLRKIHERKLSEMAELAERFLPLNYWGFQLGDCLVTGSYPVVVYQSEWCRLKLLWDQGDVYTGELLMVYYGRLHAVSDKFTMTWKGEEYNCWHGANHFLHFLDGIAPQDALHKWPQFIEKFSNNDLKEKTPFQPQRTVILHAAIWQHYGKRIFELFDLRHSDLWEKYSAFLREYYKQEGPGLIPINPPPYKVC